MLLLCYQALDFLIRFIFQWNFGREVPGLMVISFCFEVQRNCMVTFMGPVLYWRCYRQYLPNFHSFTLIRSVDKPEALLPSFTELIFFGWVNLSRFCLGKKKPEWFRTQSEPVSFGVIVSFPSWKIIEKNNGVSAISLAQIGRAPLSFIYLFIDCYPFATLRLISGRWTNQSDGRAPLGGSFAALPLSLTKKTIPTWLKNDLAVIFTFLGNQRRKHYGFIGGKRCFDRNLTALPVSCSMEAIWIEILKWFKANGWVSSFFLWGCFIVFFSIVLISSSTKMQSANSIGLERRKIFLDEISWNRGISWLIRKVIENTKKVWNMIKCFCYVLSIKSLERNGFENNGYTHSTNEFRTKYFSNM